MIMHEMCKSGLYCYLRASAFSQFVKQVKAGRKWRISAGRGVKRQELKRHEETK